MNTKRRSFVGGATAAGILTASGRSFSQKKYSDGASDSEIRIGHCCPYSGAASSIGVIGQAHQAFFRAINEAEGINGRKINFISRDDGYSPPKTVEMVRQLVEEEKVLLLFNIVGTPNNTVIHKYVNQKKIPHLFIASGASKWGDPQHFPWTMGFQPDYQSESAVYAKHILTGIKDAKVGILMQNDDAGRDYFNGFRNALGKEAGRIVKVVTYEATDAMVDSQVIQLKDSGANVFYNVSLPKFAAQAIRKAADIGWKPAQYLVNIAASVAATLKPAGFDNAQGITTAFYLKDPTDKQWDEASDMKAWRSWMVRNMPAANLKDSLFIFAFASATLLVDTLRNCGDDLTRENVMRQAAGFRNHPLPLLLPGITVTTGPADYYPIQTLRLARFKGEAWSLFGDPIQADRT